MRQLWPPSSEIYAALISQLSIIKLGSAGEIAGENMPPPPDRPMGSQGIFSLIVCEWTDCCWQFNEINKTKKNLRYLQKKHCELRFIILPFGLNGCCQRFVTYLTSERAGRIETYLPSLRNIDACGCHKLNSSCLTNLLISDLENV